jgi:hypothetical protein
VTQSPGRYDWTGLSEAIVEQQLGEMVDDAAEHHGIELTREQRRHAKKVFRADPAIRGWFHDLEHVLRGGVL